MSYWISICTKYGELADSGLYLYAYAEWWSRDGAHWERQPDHWEIYASGTQGAIMRGRGTTDWEGNAPEIEQSLREAGEHTAADALGEWVDDPVVSATAWEVDSAGIQRRCYPEAFAVDDRELATALAAVGGLSAVQG